MQRAHGMYAFNLLLAGVLLAVLLCMPVIALAQSASDAALRAEIRASLGPDAQTLSDEELNSLVGALAQAAVADGVTVQDIERERPTPTAATTGAQPELAEVRPSVEPIGSSAVAAAIFVAVLIIIALIVALWRKMRSGGAMGESGDMDYRNNVAQDSVSEREHSDEQQPPMP